MIQNEDQIPNVSAYIDVLEEREKQDQKWGEQNHNDYIWLAILSEELGEVSQAILQTDFGGKHSGKTKEELIQLAAVAIAWLECIERRKRQSWRTA